MRTAVWRALRKSTSFTLSFPFKSYLERPVEPAECPPIKSQQVSRSPRVALGPFLTSVLGCFSCSGAVAPGAEKMAVTGH